jgi:hypothetical protein
MGGQAGSYRCGLPQYPSYVGSGVGCTPFNFQKYPLLPHHPWVSSYLLLRQLPPTLADFAGCTARHIISSIVF